MQEKQHYVRVFAWLLGGINDRCFSFAIPSTSLTDTWWDNPDNFIIKIRHEWNRTLQYGKLTWLPIFYLY